jgi:hypothetical protein
MGMAIYLAGSSSEPERALQWARNLGALGIVVTSSWPSECARVAGQGGELNPSGDMGSEIARQCVAELERSTHLWLLAPLHHSAGCWWEFGYASARGLYTVISGDTHRRSVFSALTCSQHLQDKHAFDLLVDLAQQGR